MCCWSRRLRSLRIVWTMSVKITSFLSGEKGAANINRQHNMMPIFPPSSTGHGPLGALSGVSYPRHLLCVAVTPSSSLSSASSLHSTCPRLVSQSIICNLSAAAKTCSYMRIRMSRGRFVMKSDWSCGFGCLGRGSTE